MPTAPLYLDPQQIIIKRETRQRQENIDNVDDLKESISRIGLINPIIVRTTEEGPILVAGERRLKASLALNLRRVPVRFFDKLTAEEAEVVELEENIKRKELAWRDQVRSIGRLHAMYTKNNNEWKIEKTAENISIHPTYLRKILHVYEALDGGRLAKVESIDQAYNTLSRFAERKAESIVADLVVNGAAIFADVAEIPITEDFTTVNAVSVLYDDVEEDLAIDLLEDATEPPIPQPPTSVIVPKPIITDPIICANFKEWAKTYTGPKFTLIHCDFPYGNYRGGDSQGSLNALETEDFYDNSENVYWDLLDSLTSNIDRLMSYSAHLLFWFNMNFYTETVSRLRKTGLMVHDHPIIWHKTGGPGGLGVVPGTAVTYPRRTYDTALLAVRGNRPLAKPGMNSYASPTAGNKIHPSQKPEPMLRFFLQMLVDETTTMLDPTCGSAAALRAAEELGAKSILGLEMDPNYAETANTKTLQARIMRQAGQTRKED